MSLTKHERGIVAHLAELKTVSIIMSVFGLLSISLGLYCLLYRPANPYTRPLLETLTLFSFGFSVQGWLLTSAYNVIRKLMNESNNHGEQSLGRT
jgi:hypothetical protein